MPFNELFGLFSLGLFILFVLIAFGYLAYIYIKDRKGPKGPGRLVIKTESAPGRFVAGQDINADDPVYVGSAFNQFVRFAGITSSATVSAAAPVVESLFIPIYLTDLANKQKTVNIAVRAAGDAAKRFGEVANEIEELTALDHCEYCGAERSIYGLCPGCGRSLGPGDPCAYCGENNDAGAVVCGHCGAWLGSGESTQ